MKSLDRFNLEGKTALVTGCKRGIGKSMAVGLAEAGADIVGVSATLERSGSDVETEVLALGRSFLDTLVISLIVKRFIDLSMKSIPTTIRSTFLSTMRERSCASQPWTIPMSTGTK